MHDVKHKSSLVRAIQVRADAELVYRSTVLLYEQSAELFVRAIWATANTSAAIKRSSACLLEAQRTLENCWRDPFAPRKQ